MRRAVRRVLVTALTPWVHCPRAGRPRLRDCSTRTLRTPSMHRAGQALSADGSAATQRLNSSSHAPSRTDSQGEPLCGPKHLTQRGLLMEGGGRGGEVGRAEAPTTMTLTGPWTADSSGLSRSLVPYKLPSLAVHRSDNGACGPNPGVATRAAHFPACGLHKESQVFWQTRQSSLLMVLVAALGSCMYGQELFAQARPDLDHVGPRPDVPAAANLIR